MKEEHRRKLGGKRLVPSVLLLPLLLLALPGSSLAFDMVGPRAMAMGGAFVAVCDDATAVYWNPAAITQIKGADISAFAGAKGTDRFADEIDDLEDWTDDHPGPVYDRAEIEDLQDILDRFNEDEVGVFGNAHAGLALATKHIALSAVGLADGNLNPHADTEPSHLATADARAHNDSRVDINSLLTNNIALTLATPIGIPNLALGVNAKYIQAFRYTDSYRIFDDSGDYNDNIDYKKRFNDNRVDGWAWGIDAGALIILGEVLKIGVLGRNINEPEIDWEDDQPKTKLRGQYRAGAALTIAKVFTLSVDADITKQGREVIETRSGKKFEFDESQEVSAGFEWWAVGRYLALRGGVNNITESGDTDRFYTAGLGVRVPFVGLDLAAGYGGEDRYAGSLALNVSF